MAWGGLARRVTVAALGCAVALTASPADLRAGERIYREGILPSGAPLRPALEGGVVIPGTTFACAGCHLRSGLGSFDEGVTTPAVNGRKLFQPLPRLFKGIPQAMEPLRPAYTRESLVAVIRTGVDPTGRVLGEGMPRYVLSDEDAKLLVSYLEALSSEFSPGVTDSSIRLATVVSEEVPAQLRDALLSTLAADFERKNNQIGVIGNRRYERTRLMAELMLESRELATKRMLLSTWVLKGPPESWRAQLEEYERVEPPFALVGGIVRGDWRPIHQFCEERRIPAIFPITDLPVLSHGDWYTLYLSKGLFQEGDAAARFLDGKLKKGRTVLQLVRASPEGERLSAGFRQGWSELGRPPPVTVPLAHGAALDEPLLKKLVAREKPSALVVWDDATALPALQSLGRRPGRLELLFLSGGYLGEASWNLDDSIRDLAWLTWPSAFAPYIPPVGMARRNVKVDTRRTLKRADLQFKDDAQKVASLTTSLTQLLTTLLMEVKGGYYRDNLLDVTAMVPDQPWPVVGRISLAGGQRYASAGCLIVQLSHGADPALLEKGGR